MGIIKPFKQKKENLMALKHTIKYVQGNFLAINLTTF